ncbi:MAG TPA: hypothetical protein VLH94_00105 [Spirochaetia bacterium]|nr:hypothetical protein [Spirochaetia bacterium]
MRKYKIVVVFGAVIIFLLGLFLRLYRLDLNIPSLYADEVGGHYIFRQQLLDPDISSIQRIIRIIQITPLSYSWLFGLTPFGARIASAVNGSLICLGVFLFVYSVSQKENNKKRIIVSLLSCLFAAVLPWSFMMSRIFSHIPLMLFFICIHLFLFIRSNTTKSDLLSLIPLFIGTYFYMSMAVIAPFAIILVFLSIFKRSTTNQRKSFVAISILIGSLFLFVFIDKFGLLNPKGRGLDLAIWNDINVTADSNFNRGIARNSEPTLFSFGKDTEALSNKLVFNYPISVINVFVKNYLSFFSPDFLFLKGDNVLRHSTGMVGQFWPVLLPFMVYGAYVFFKTANTKTKTLFLIWILVSPVPGAITKDGATYLLRVITLMPFLTFFCAQGIVSIFALLKNVWQKTAYILLISGIVIFSAYYFYYGYFHVYPTTSAQSWEYGFKEITEFSSANPEKTLIVWDDRYPYLYFCFWQQLSLEQCNPQKIVNMVEMVNDSRVDLPFSNLLFSMPKNETDLSQIISKYKPVYIVLFNNYEEIYPRVSTDNELVKKILYPNQTTAFSIYKVNN